MLDDRGHLITREHHRNIRSAFDTDNVADLAEVFLENIPKKEQQRIERLVLRGSGDLARNREPGQERLDVLRSERRWVGVLFEPLELPDPVAVGSQGLGGIMLCFDGRSHFSDGLHPLRLRGSRRSIILKGRRPARVRR